MRGGLLIRTMLALTVTSVLVVAGMASCGVSEVDLTGKACPCADGYVCDAANNVCVRPGDITAAGAADASGDGTVVCPEAGCPCQTDAQCTDPTAPKCQMGRCLACTMADDRCPVGRFCTATNVCTVGCKDDAECMTLSPSAPYCNPTRHQCVACKGKADCMGAQVCSPSGNCVEACAGEAGSCSGSNSCCSGLCVNETTDVFNCKGCGVGCTGAQTLCCSSSCTDPATSTQNCGSCGFTCSTTNATPVCSGGNCGWLCNQGYGHCATGNTGCETNTTITTNHCGDCARDCNQRVQAANGVSCGAGQCTYTTCMTGHLDCDNDKANGCETAAGVCPTCGLKNQPCCGSGPQCVAGMGLVCQVGTCQFD